MEAGLRLPDWLVGFWTVLLCLVVLLVGVVLISCVVGSVSLTLTDVSLAMQGQADATTAAIVQQRVSRTALGVLVGLALGVAGALMQAVTRNPLADPGILGVNAGAGFAVTVGVALWGITGIGSYIWLSLVGAFVATATVYALAGRGAMASPVRLVLVGLALGSVLIGASRVLALLSPSIFDAMRFWGAGTLANRPEHTVATVLPFIVLGCVVAACLGRSLDVLALGSDIARSSGVNIAWVLAASLVAVTALCGAATAAGGPIAFVGLLVPQMARFMVGASNSRVLVVSAVLAPIVVLVADVLGRVLVNPRELQVGVLASAVGSLVLIFLMRRALGSRGL